MRLLVTGGAGFIGSNFCRKILREERDYRVVVLDLLTYCGNLDNFTQKEWENPNFLFVKGDIRDREKVEGLMRTVDQVVHFAAETHIDRSIQNSDPFVSTDVVGTQVLLEAIRKYPVERFIHISTSEVYGSAVSIPMSEDHPLNAQSPYAATKVGADRLAYSFYFTYQLPIIILRPFNNYGPNQYPEKLIPLFVTNAMGNQPLPVYRDGKNTRDWIYVEDCCEAVLSALKEDVKQVQGEVINIGTGKEVNVRTITDTVLKRLHKRKSLRKFVKDRPGHVQRLISDTKKAKEILNFSAKTEFSKGILKTIDWYVKNKKWWKDIKEGRKEYREFYERWYKER